MGLLVSKDIASLQVITTFENSHENQMRQKIPQRPLTALYPQIKSYQCQINDLLAPPFVAPLVRSALRAIMACLMRDTSAPPTY